ncbi:hypothetical protein Slala04_30500 [Streptomyces lavendulae subsp. lavendulae]|nr:hypothetical protein Slala04_30500 [Streptomyces lavendulae subsp. lavendulae]
MTAQRACRASDTEERPGGEPGESDEEQGGNGVDLSHTRRIRAMHPSGSWRAYIHSPYPKGKIPHPIHEEP